MNAPSWQLEAEELHRLQPRHLLFLCVANSARSQMAEGIARSFAPAGVRVSSAGTRPSSVHPLAIRVLEEIGIDIRGQRSKSVEEIDPAGVDAVITLCAEEACPAFLGKAQRVHWALPEPVAAGANEEEQLRRFRSARDELRRRLALLFPERAALREVRYEPAAAADLPEVRALLQSLHLPDGDLGGARQAFVIARDGSELIGCVGLETCGEDALIRSLAVAPRLQGSGIGSALHTRALEEAERRGTKALYLLTTTAEWFFAARGYVRIERSTVPPLVAATAEFAALCPATAVCMRRALR